MDDIKIPSQKQNNQERAFPTEASLTSPQKKFMPEEVIDMSKNNQSPINSPKKHFKITKKQLIIVSIIVILAIAGALYYFLFYKKDQPVNTTVTTTKKEEPPKPPTSPLTGRVVESEAIAKRPVTAIMIENSPDARPQSGLKQADTVVEAVAEGGVTRFMAAYLESTPDYIGPIRSARPYYVDYALAFDASYAHVGGSPEALSDIKTLGVKDLDQFFNPDAYFRINSRYAPHNMYSDFTKLDALNQSKGYTSSKFTPFERKINVAQTPTANSVSFSLSGATYNPTFTYDAATNSYIRSQAGSNHNDFKSGEPINPKVVVAIVLDKSSDGYNTIYQTSGNGTAYIFQDGIVSQGSWNKPDRKSSVTLTDKNGLPMKLNAGQTWITLVGSPGDINYQP